MQAIILAAGRGRRLVKHTADLPKALLPIQGKPLIKYLIDSLLECGVNQFVIVAGYKKNKVKDFLLKNYKNRANFLFVENPIYHQTNNIYSLYLAKDFFNKDTILVECDILIDKESLCKLIKTPEKNAALISPYSIGMDGSAVTLDIEGYINNFIDGDEIIWSQLNNFYKTVNIYKFSSDFLKKIYLPFLETYISVKGRDAYYEHVLKVITSIRDFVKIKGIIIDRNKWLEIDTPEDKIHAEVYLSSNPIVLESQYFGGFWRFENLKDFVFITNPFFPPKTFFEELKTFIDKLVVNYPSKLHIFSKLLSSILNIDEDFIIAGNGASELIKILANILPTPRGTIVPTFEEYAIISHKYLFSFNYNANTIIDFIQKNKIKVLFLVNPNNPTGFLLKTEELLNILEFSLKENIILVLDESFIDFSDKSASLLNEKILRNYENLIIIKSLSKTWGIPGIRLGFIVTSNKGFLNKIKKSLPIWNINSIAEYILKTFLKYKDIYTQSLDLVKKERAFLYNNLLILKNFIKIYPSQANFFLIENTSDISTNNLVEYLFREYNILVKHLSSYKKGIKSNNFIRIAIKTREENEILLRALKKFFNKAKR